MRYKLTSNSGVLLSLESDLKEAENQARYYLKKDTSIERIDIIEIDTDEIISSMERW